MSHTQQPPQRWWAQVARAGSWPSRCHPGCKSGSTGYSCSRAPGEIPDLICILSASRLDQLPQTLLALFLSAKLEGRFPRTGQWLQCEYCPPRWLTHEKHTVTAPPKVMLWYWTVGKRRRGSMAWCPSWIPRGRNTFALRWERELTCCVPRGLLWKVLEAVIVCVGSRALRSHIYPPTLPSTWRCQLTRKGHEPSPSNPSNTLCFGERMLCCFWIIFNCEYSLTPDTGLQQMALAPFKTCEPP